VEAAGGGGGRSSAVTGTTASADTDEDARCTFIMRVAPTAAVGAQLSLTLEATPSPHSQGAELVLPLSVGPVMVAVAEAVATAAAAAVARASAAATGATGAATAPCYRSLPILPSGRSLVLLEAPPESATIADSTWDCGVLLGRALPSLAFQLHLHTFENHICDEGRNRMSDVMRRGT
jgi:hypothetical protein